MKMKLLLVLSWLVTLLLVVLLFTRKESTPIVTQQHKLEQSHTISMSAEQTQTVTAKGKKTSQVQKSTDFSPEGKVTRIVETTTTEEEEQEDASVTNSTKQVQEDSRTDTTTRIERDNRGSTYSLGVSIQRSLRENITAPISRGEVEIEIGRKVIGDLWVTGAYRLDNTIRLGFRLEF